MASKPATGDGYGSEELALVRQICLYLATKLGDLLEDVAVVGGLVPSLLVDQDVLSPGMDPHAGTRDLDLALALPILSTERYQALRDRLQEAGFASELWIVRRSLVGLQDGVEAACSEDAECIFSVEHKQVRV